MTGLLVSSGLDSAGRAENDLYSEGRTPSLGNHSITATFELRRVYKGLPC